MADEKEGKPSSGWDIAKSRAKKQTTPQVDTIEKSVKKPFPISLEETLKDRVLAVVNGPLGFRSMNKFVIEAIKDKLDAVEPLHFELTKKRDELEGLSPKELRNQTKK